MKKVPQVDLGYFTVPVEYNSFTKEEKEKVCDRIIDSIYKYIDRHLEPNINRISFLEEVFESSLLTNEEDENYEMCCVIKDCIDRLNED
jgi:hypothetical protein